MHSPKHHWVEVKLAGQKPWRFGLFNFPRKSRLFRSPFLGVSSDWSTAFMLAVYHSSWASVQCQNKTAVKFGTLFHHHPPQSRGMIRGITVCHAAKCCLWKSTQPNFNAYAFSAKYSNITALVLLSIEHVALQPADSSRCILSISSGKCKTQLLWIGQNFLALNFFILLVLFCFLFRWGIYFLIGVRNAFLCAKTIRIQTISLLLWCCTLPEAL